MSFSISPVAGLALLVTINLAIFPPDVHTRSLWAQDPPRNTDVDKEKSGKEKDPENVDSAVQQQIEQFFKEYAAAARADTADALLHLVDFKTFGDLILEQSQVELPDPVRGLFVTQLRDAAKQEFGIDRDMWFRHRVVNTTHYKDGKTVEVFVRLWSEAEETTRVIFWLEKSDRLRIVDWFNVEIGVRTSAMVASIMRETHASEQSRESLKTLNLLKQLFVAARQLDNDGTQTLLYNLRGRYVPNSLEGLRWIVEATSLLYYDPLSVLEAVDKAAAFEPDAVLADFLRSSAYYNLGEYQRAIHHAERYLNRFGDDESSLLIKGMSHAELGQQDDAIATYEAGLKENPQSFDLIVQYASIIPEDQQSKLSTCFRAFPTLMESFQGLADEFEVNGEYIALKVLLDTVESLGQEAPHRQYYESIVLQGQGDPAAALEKLILAADELAADDDYRGYYESAICDAAIKSSQAMRAYENCQDKVNCFSHLMTALQGRILDEQSDELTRSEAETIVIDLVANHLSGHATDSESYRILGEHAYALADFEQAKSHYDMAIKYYTDDDIPYPILNRLVDCHVETNTIVAFYQSSNFKKPVYDIASYSISFDSDEFKELARLHRLDFPNIPGFVLEQMTSLYAEKRYQEALDASDKVDEASTEEDTDDSSYYSMQQIKFIRVHCLARLGRNDEAILSARRLDAMYQDSARAGIFAIRNDGKAFRGAIQRLIDAGHELSREEFTEWVEVPEEWFDGLISKDSDETATGNADFFQYREIRRLVFLANEPIPLDMLSIREAAAEVGTDLFEIHRDQLLTEKENFLCALADDAFLVSSDGYKFFLSKSDSKFLNQTSSSRINFNADELLQSRFTEHTAWFSIDVLAWPQAADRETTSAIPQEAVRKMVRMAEILLGGKATVAIHSDSEQAVGCDTDLFSRLQTTPTIGAFYPENEMDAD